MPQQAEAEVARAAVIRAGGVIAAERHAVEQAVTAILSGATPPPLPRHPAVDRPTPDAAKALQELAQLRYGHYQAMLLLAPELRALAQAPLEVDLDQALPPPPPPICVEPPELMTLDELRQHATNISRR